MNIFAVIAEFNPLHQGHAFLLQEAREKSGADYCVILMSGNYVQRGEPAFLDKDLRTEAALRCGADLVLELPVPFATGSAEYFASAAVSLLDRLGCITHLSFGSEAGNLDLLEKGAAVLEKESPVFQEILQKNLKSGNSYPSARESAASQSGMAYDTAALLHSPNNILALEYLKALRRLNSSMKPLTIMRKGSGYHDQALTDYGIYASAEAIRLAVHQNESMESILQTVPEAAVPLIRDAILSGSFVPPDLISLPLFQMLCQADASKLQLYQDVSSALAEKIIHFRDHYFLYKDLICALKSKDLTYSRISRSLLHILLGITKADVQSRKEDGYTTYASVLGFRKDSLPLLHHIKSHTSIPMITKYSDAGRFLNLTDRIRFEKDLRADAFYQTLISSHRYSYTAASNKSEQGEAGIPAHTGFSKEAAVKNIYSSRIIIV